MPTENSGLREAVTSRVDGVRRALGGSRVIAATESAGKRATRFVKHSWLYGWLTAEPEPEVIVIDLRETWTVGPFIAILDRVIETLTPWYRQSVLKRGVDAVVGLGERVADTRVGELLIKLLEPPEPPAENREPKRESTNEGDDEREDGRDEP